MSLNRQEMFAAWAPPASPWSAWAKPVLFTTIDWSPSETLRDGSDPGILQRMHDAALVIDLAGDQSVLLGIALAKAGFQPVPLYNAADDPASLVNMTRIARALGRGADFLKSLPAKPDARPAFLMNSDRMANGVNATAPGRFDNRWGLVPQDMPSADFLKAAGIRKVVLVSEKLADDVSHVLYRYQQAGLEIVEVASTAGNPRPLTLPRPASFKSLWYRLGVYAGLRRNAAGGFGAMTPDPSSYGGGG